MVDEAANTFSTFYETRIFMTRDTLQIKFLSFPVLVQIWKKKKNVGKEAKVDMKKSVLKILK